jgi:hypothetical protein
VLVEYRLNARALFDAEFNAERNYQILMGIYQVAIGDFRQQKTIMDDQA